MSARRESCSQIIPRTIALMNYINDMLTKERGPRDRRMANLDNLKTFGRSLQKEMSHYFQRYLDNET